MIDFARYQPGQRTELRNLGGPNSVDFDNTGQVMAFVVTADQVDTRNNTVPRS